MNTTCTAAKLHTSQHYSTVHEKGTYAAVDANISALRALVTVANISEKAIVKAATTPKRTIMRLI